MRYAAEIQVAGAVVCGTAALAVLVASYAATALRYRRAYRIVSDSPPAGVPAGVAVGLVVAVGLLIAAGALAFVLLGVEHAP